MRYSPQFNIRSAYNFQQSFIKIDDYISFAQTHNFEYLFYSELRTMFGVAEFIKKARAANLKPIIGLSIDINESIINLYPKTRQGYQQINRISANLNDGKNYNNDEIVNMIFENLNLEIIVVSNLSNEINLKLSSRILSDDFYDVKKLKLFFNEINYFDIGDEDDYYALVALKNNLLINEVPLLQPTNYWDDSEISQQYSLSKTSQVAQEIYQKVKFELFDNSELHLIAFKAPQNIPSDKYLEKICFSSLENYFKFVKRKEIPNTYTERLNYELKIIFSMGFENYFLVVWDYVKYAKERNILVGPGRGSAAGSLVAFLLQITQVDPIAYNLLFERFLNPERITMPDIDIDFQDDRREEVIEYLFEKYGLYNVATITTYQSIGVKSAIRDVARVHGLDLNIVNTITKQIPSIFLNDLDGAIKSNTKLKQYFDEYTHIFKTVKKLIGLPRQTGTHAAGVILVDNDLRDYVPIKVGYNGIYQTQFDMNHLEELGLIKMDLLGLRNLTTLQEIRYAIYRNRKQNVIFAKIPLNDKQTFAMLAQGNTSGIFQLESPGMTKVIKNMQVANIEDISAASALFRPGPQEMIPEYIKRKNSSNKNYLIDSSLGDILNSTYGIIVYQEQVIQILQRVANFSLGKADIVRRAMGKKNHQYMLSVKTEFLQGAVANKYTIEKAEEIWNWIDRFAAYGFNKSHSIAYSYISYWLAYFKTHYTEEFYCSLLNGVIGNAEKTSQYLKEIAQYGVQVRLPSVKNVNYSYVGKSKQIFMPLILIKGIGKDFIKRIRLLFEEDHSAFDSIFSFVTRMINNGLNKTNYLVLAKAGAFDIFGYNRQTLIDNMELIIAFAEFNYGVKKLDPLTYPLLEETEIQNEIISEYEKEIYGFYLTSHPITKIKIDNAGLKPTDINKAKSFKGYSNVIGYVAMIRTKKDKNNQEMAFLNLIDDTDEIDITIFAGTYQKIKYDLQAGIILGLEIQTEEYQGKISGKLNRIIKVIKK
ncbi:DNA polymerase III subunit alpha [Mesoplasma syrphidae]|uniref:DNA-directed DNA polymerase n=1 Tax=Mesoplasma syrphidae TaxID=225999 RepID=A0A2K9C1L7_9MOLU|nr:DNA polymerase III subunit alpha [Mesoplasma syrphidae]AUF83369.1 DNA polymerase III subunit alpha [Mesoplasma syrphidae]